MQPVCPTNLHRDLCHKPSLSFSIITIIIAMPSSPPPSKSPSFSSLHSLVEISWILRHDGATQENRRIRRRLQGAAAPKPPIEALHFSWSIDQVLFLLLLLSEETIHNSHTRKVIYSEINYILYKWPLVCLDFFFDWLDIPWSSETFFWQDHLTKPIFNKLHLSSDEQFSQKS